MSKPLVQIRRLTQVLILSGTLNIILFSLIIYSFVRERPPTPYCSLRPAAHEEQQSPLAIDLSNSEVLQIYSMLPYSQLMPKMENKQLVENGYSVRDLALGCLITYHHFDLSRALLGLEKPKQQRTLSFGKNREIIVFRDLTEEQYDAINRFLKTESWPFTGRGLFIRLQEGNQELSLVDAFFCTPEFMTVEMLFNRADVRVSKVELLRVVLEGSWEMLAAFASQQHTLQDLSPPRRQMFLLQYIDTDSQAAAYLLLKTDGAFALQKLDDHRVIKVLSLLNVQTPDSEKYALSLVTSPRSDAVLKEATNRLYAYVGVAPAPAPPPKPAPVIVSKPSKPRTKTVQVQPGDSLWKIAKKHKTTIKAIVKLNNIDESITLRPGMSLIIPI